MARKNTLEKYKGLSVNLVSPIGERFTVTKPLTKTAIIQQLRDNKGEYSSFVTDYIRGKEGSYEVYGNFTEVTFREWTPGSSYGADSNSKITRIKVENPASAKRMIIAFMLDD